MLRGDSTPCDDTYEPTAVAYSMNTVSRVTADTAPRSEQADQASLWELYHAVAMLLHKG